MNPSPSPLRTLASSRARRHKDGEVPNDPNQIIGELRQSLRRFFGALGSREDPEVREARARLYRLSGHIVQSFKANWRRHVGEPERQTEPFPLFLLHSLGEEKLVAAYARFRFQENGATPLQPSPWALPRLDPIARKAGLSSFWTLVLYFGPFIISSRGALLVIKRFLAHASSLDDDDDNDDEHRQAAFHRLYRAAYIQAQTRCRQGHGRLSSRQLQQFSGLVHEGNEGGLTFKAQDIQNAALEIYPNLMLLDNQSIHNDEPADQARQPETHAHDPQNVEEEQAKNQEEGEQGKQQQAAEGDAAENGAQAAGTQLDGDTGPDQELPAPDNQGQHQNSPLLSLPPLFHLVESGGSQGVGGARVRQDGDPSSDQDIADQGEDQDSSLFAETGRRPRSLSLGAARDQRGAEPSSDQDWPFSNDQDQEQDQDPASSPLFPLVKTARRQSLDAALEPGQSILGASSEGLRKCLFRGRGTAKSLDQSHDADRSSSISLPKLPGPAATEAEDTEFALDLPASSTPSHQMAPVAVAGSDTVMSQSQPGSGPMSFTPARGGILDTARITVDRPNAGRRSKRPASEIIILDDDKAKHDQKKIKGNPHNEGGNRADATIVPGSSSLLAGPSILLTDLTSLSAGNWVQGHAITALLSFVTVLSNRMQPARRTECVPSITTLSVSASTPTPRQPNAELQRWRRAQRLLLPVNVSKHWLLVV
ncbi:hypothetical protein GGR56DRAFT_153852 [Xylariaceae sp. FL0804]|nr:hypothetical protein GGR56DRAFT_153852 [Xylariaceae sp. FL0804]